jgi:hypothetical protein
MQREVVRILEHPQLDPGAANPRAASPAARFLSRVFGADLPPRRQKLIVALAGCGILVPWLFASWVVFNSEAGPGSDPARGRGAHVVSSAPVVVAPPVESTAIALPAVLQPTQSETEQAAAAEQEQLPAPAVPVSKAVQPAAQPVAAARPAAAPSKPKANSGPAAGAPGKGIATPPASASDPEPQASPEAAVTGSEKADGVSEPAASASVAAPGEPAPSEPAPAPPAGDGAEGGEEKKATEPPALEPGNPY